MPIKKKITDRIIGYFSPKTELRRLQARALIGAYEQSGGYNGASRKRAAIGSFNPVSGDISDDSAMDLPMLRSRSRDLVRNTPIAGGSLKTMVTYVVGTGLTMRSKIDGVKLGMIPGTSGAWQDEVNSRFSIWAESTDCDIARGMNFYGIQALALKSMLESGDVGILLTQNQKGKLAIQLIEADRICNKDDTRDTATLIAGVEIDSNGAPLNYHICNQHPTAWKPGLKRTWTIVPAFGQQTGRPNFILMFERLRPGQVRGIPVLAPVIELIKQLGRFTDAELQAAVLNGSFAVFLKMDPTAFGDLFDDAGKNTYMEQASKWNGSYPDATLGGPGKVVNLLPGEEVIESNPGRPNSEFDPFVNAILTQIGMELGLPVEVMLKKFTSSYSAARASMLDAWRLFKVRREFLCSYFCNPVYSDWLAREIAAGKIEAKGFFEDDLLRAYWENADWIGDSQGAIDPMKEVAAAQQRVDMGISTIENESIAFDGGEFWSKHKQRTNEHKLRLQSDLEPANTIKAQQSVVNVGQ